jgi:hypothetical protein
MTASIETTPELLDEWKKLSESNKHTKIQLPEWQENHSTDNHSHKK